MREITTCGGKYKTILTDDGKLIIERYGNEWRNDTGDGYILSLIHRIEELESSINSIINWPELDVYPSAWEFCYYDGEEAMAKLEEALNGGKCT